MSSATPKRRESIQSPVVLPAIRAWIRSGSAWLAHLVALGLVIANLAVSGQPIYANDTWVHLALGEVFAQQGPWLSEDPHLFAAPGPPSPSSWLGSVLIYAIHAAAGFTGLRIFHVLAVLFILVLVWAVIRRASGNAVAASAGTAGFIALSTYRLVQLRPDLFTIAATLALYPLLFASREGPSRAQTLSAAALVAIWANIHAAFLLGPLLALGSSVALACYSTLPAEVDFRAADRARAGRLAIAGLAMLVASLANPQGISAHLAYFASGTDTAPLEMVMDEWGPTNLFAWPVPFVPPTLAAWLISWIGSLGVITGVGVLFHVRAGSARGHPRPIDPVLLSLAAAGLLAAAAASRFLWLVVFALALIGSMASRLEDGDRDPIWPSEDSASKHPDAPTATRFGRPSGDTRGRSGARAVVVTTCMTLFTVAVAVLHARWGDWPVVSRALGVDYTAPYPSERYNTHAIWFLADTGVEGHIFNDYPLGGFMSFWLAPKLQMASSGTMNVGKEAMKANLAVGARQTVQAGEDYAALLDRRGFDLFLGSGYPIEATPGRPVPCTTRHLEHEPGWLLVFRNLRSAIYLRRNAENAANLERIAAYYARAGVPFDRERGFETERVIRTAPRWSIDHGVIPFDFEALVAHVRSLRQQKQIDIQTHRLAIIYATLGLYDRALEVDRLIQKLDPGDSVSAWRVVWSLIQRGHWTEAMEEAERLEARSRVARPSGGNPWSAMLAKLRTADPAARTTLVAHLPVMRLEQVEWLRSGVVVSPARSERSSALP